MTFTFKKSAKSSQQERQSEYSFVTPMTQARKEQLTKEINEIFEGKRQSVTALTAEIIEIISEPENKTT